MIGLSNFPVVAFRHSCNNSPMSDWGKEVAAWRKKSRLMQKEASDKLGVPFHTFRNWEYGKNEPCKFVKNKIREVMNA